MEKSSGDTPQQANSSSPTTPTSTSTATPIPIPTPATGDPTRFPARLHRMLADIEENRQGMEQIISWQPHGKCFMIRDKQAFIDKVMPTYFYQLKYVSFQRQLNLYGFKKMYSRGPDRGAYYHEQFVRDKPELAAKIERVKSTRGPGNKKSNAEDEPDFYANANDNATSEPIHPIKSHFKQERDREREYGCEQQKQMFKRMPKNANKDANNSKKCQTISMKDSMWEASTANAKGPSTAQSQNTQAPATLKEHLLPNHVNSRRNSLASQQQRRLSFELFHNNLGMAPMAFTGQRRPIQTGMGEPSSPMAQGSALTSLLGAFDNEGYLNNNTININNNNSSNSASTSRRGSNPGWGSNRNDLMTPAWTQSDAHTAQRNIHDSVDETLLTQDFPSALRNLQLQQQREAQQRLQPMNANIGTGLSHNGENTTVLKSGGSILSDQLQRSASAPFDAAPFNHNVHATTRLANPPQLGEPSSASTRTLPINWDLNLLEPTPINEQLNADAVQGNPFQRLSSFSSTGCVGDNNSSNSNSNNNEQNHCSSSGGQCLESYNTSSSRLTADFLYQHQQEQRHYQQLLLLQQQQQEQHLREQEEMQRKLDALQQQQQRRREQAQQVLLNSNNNLFMSEGYHRQQQQQQQQHDMLSLQQQAALLQQQQQQEPQQRQIQPHYETIFWQQQQQQEPQQRQIQPQYETIFWQQQQQQQQQQEQRGRFQWKQDM